VERKDGPHHPSSPCTKPYHLCYWWRQSTDLYSTYKRFIEQVGSSLSVFLTLWSKKRRRRKKIIVNWIRDIFYVLFPSGWTHHVLFSSEKERKKNIETSWLCCVSFSVSSLMSCPAMGKGDTVYHGQLPAVHLFFYKLEGGGGGYRYFCPFQEGGGAGYYTPNTIHHG
jgi:hypothetical protein